MEARKIADSGTHVCGTWATVSLDQFACCTYARPEFVTHVSTMEPTVVTDVM